MTKAAKDTPAPTTPPAQRPNWVQVGTFVIALATLLTSSFTAWNAVRLTRLQAQLAEFQTRAQIVWRYVVLAQDNACASLFGGGSLAVVQNAVAESYSTIACEDAAMPAMLAGLVAEDPDTGSALFAPRLLLDVVELSVQPGSGIWEASVTPGLPSSALQLGFVEEGAPSTPFVPLAILDQDGLVLDPKVVRPLNLRWISPISQEETILQLGWFRPRSEWIADDAMLFAQ
jgi:hypothetical protein